MKIKILANKDFYIFTPVINTCSHPITLKKSSKRTGMFEVGIASGLFLPEYFSFTASENKKLTEKNFSNFFLSFFFDKKFSERVPYSNEQQRIITSTEDFLERIMKFVLRPRETII